MLLPGSRLFDIIYSVEIQWPQSWRDSPEYVLVAKVKIKHTHYGADTAIINDLIQMGFSRI